MNFDITTLFVVGLLLAGVGTIFYYWIMARVSQTGVRVKSFATILDTMRMFRAYRQLAASRGWPIWPIFGFWMAVAGLFAVVVAMAMGFEGNGRMSTGTSVRISPAFFLIWVSFVSLSVALWSTCQLILQTPRLDTGRRNWKHVLRDEYLRSDLYLAVLGWSGLIILWVLYASGWVTVR